MTTATEDPSCDLLEDYHISHLLHVCVLNIPTDDKSYPSYVSKSARRFVSFFDQRIVEAQQSSSHVQYYIDAPVVGPTPENFHSDSILLDSQSKIWFAGDTGQFIERGHVLSALCKFEVMLIVDYLKLPVTISDINKARGSFQLSEWLTISPDVALAIIECRRRGGAFEDKEELINRVSAVQTKR